MLFIGAFVITHYSNTKFNFELNKNLFNLTNSSIGSDYSNNKQIHIKDIPSCGSNNIYKIVINKNIKNNENNNDYNFTQHTGTNINKELFNFKKNLSIKISYGVYIKLIICQKNKKNKI